MTLPTLYPPQVGSPYTTLAASFTTGATTMTLTDASLLPDSPNQVCLSGASGAGEFSYSGKSGNTLTGVVANSGTPSTTWAAGDYAFRGITAYDLRSLQSYVLDNQARLNVIEYYDSPITGVLWDTSSSSPTLQHIDENGDTFTPTSYFFDRHLLWGARWRCERNRTTGAITYGENARGDGLDLTGATSDVLVRKPAVYAKAYTDGDYRGWLVSPRASAGFALHPWWLSRGGVAQPVMYDGAFEAYGYLSGSTFVLGSATGKTPVTGGVSYPDLPNSGRFNIADAETYAGNIGDGFGCKNFWGHAADQLMMYIEYGSLDIQTAFARGVVDLASGTGFAGKLTGADSIDSRLGVNGTGVGSGTNGQTPICWRGNENPYGNVWEFSIGANAYLDGTMRLIRRDGTGTLAATLAEGSYETVTGPLPLANGYVSGLLDGDLEDFSFLPSAAAGSSSTYLADYWYATTANGNILLAGGSWHDGTNAGPGDRAANNAPSDSYRLIGARVEFAPLGA